MALITDIKTTKKLNDRLNEFSNFGMTIYYLLEEDKIKLKSISEIFFNKDEDKAVVMYLNLIKHIKSKDIEEAYIKYSTINPNTTSISEDKYKDYLNILYISKIINKIAGENNYCIDKTYVNTYNYLLENNRLKTLLVEAGD